MSRRTPDEMLSALERWAVEAGQPSVLLVVLSAHSVLAKFARAAPGRVRVPEKHISQHN